MLVSTAAAARADTDPVDFNRDIRPILADNCFKCHGPDANAREAGLRLDLRDAAISARTKDGAAAITPGDAKRSLVLHRVAHNDPSERMPPPDIGARLSDEEIATLAQWIDAGAEYEPHWAFVAPSRPTPPIVGATDWPRNTIDHFVLARLDSEGLTPTPEADRYTLIRRLSLDLTGLPPTPELADTFVNDDSPNAYERLVDRLLASPAFGERWARVWLDAARYADTKGYEADRRRTMWPYRDWVIRALNDDMPFDEFTRKQIAGDLLEEPTRDDLIATAFHRNTMTNDEGGTDDEEFRVAAVVDRVNTTMQTWMGLTAACAQCHTHKYDPIDHEEYFELFAFFNQTADTDAMDESPTLALYTDEQERRLAELDAALDEYRRQRRTLVESIAYEDPWPLESPRDPKAPVDFVWIDDEVPLDGNPQGSGLERIWEWVEPDSFNSISGSKVLRGAANAEHAAQSYFTDADPIVVREGDTLFAHVRIDPENPPRELVLQWLTAGPNWEHRAYWGENLIDWGTDGSPSRLRQGDLPAPRGEWIRLEVDAASVGLPPGSEVIGWAFSQFGGLVHWDAAGVRSAYARDDRHLISQRAWELRVLERESGGAPGEVRAAVAFDPADRSDDDATLIRDYYLARVHRDTRGRFDELNAAERETIDERGGIESETTHLPIMRELAADERRTTHVHIRGNFLEHGPSVSAGTPAFLHEFPDQAPRDRLGLAEWLVDSRNPLTARVQVNRVWQQLFGVGLVETSDDFGIQGAWPSHPQLLDWLALEYEARGWSLKELLRLVVTSSTYRQAARVTPELFEYDPYNRMLARGPRFRLEAEMIRDQALAIGGLLDASMYGPPVYPPQPAGVWEVVYSGEEWPTSDGAARYRRALYTFWRRTSPYPSMTTFDAPSREFCISRRIRTNTPLQALVTLNDPVYVEAAQALARRAMVEAADDKPDSIARRAFRLALTRPPRPDELARLIALYETEREHFTLNLEEARAAATDPIGELPASLDPVDAAAWSIVASVILNLDETLTKG